MSEDTANMEYTNEDETILSKLGIIQSTLECPKKKRHSKSGCNASDTNNISVSSDDSSDDCLFDSERFLQARKRRPLQNKLVRLENGSHKFTKWHIMCLMSVFVFVGLLATTRNLSVFTAASSDKADFFTGFSATFGFSYIIGCFLAGHVFSRLNTFAIFLVLMVLLMPFSLLIIWKSTLFSFNWSAFLTGLLLVCIERGGLLVCSLSHNYQRIFFSLYMAMSLGSLIASLLMANNGMLMSGDIQFRAVSTSTKLVVKRDNGKQSAPITLHVVSTPQVNVTNSTLTTTPATQLNSNTTTIVLDPNKIIFKSKTEENMIRRKEVEQRQKEKEKLLATYTTTTTTISNTTSTSTTHASTSAATTLATTSTMASTTNTPPSPLTTLSIPTNTSHLAEGNMGEEPWNILVKLSKTTVPSSSHVTQIVLTILVFVLPVPLLLAFCCCRFSTSLLPDAKLLEMLSKAKERTAVKAEPAGFKAWSSLVWLVHAVMESLLLVCLPMCSEELVKSQGGGSQPSAALVNTLIWFPATIVRLFFVIRPSLGGASASVIHLFYCTSIFFHLLVHFLTPHSETRTTATVLVAGLFSCSLPLFVYNWLSVFLEANPLHLSGRFLMSQAVGRTVGTYAFKWLADDKIPSFSAQQSIGRLLNSVLCLLVVAYVFFFWLTTSTHKAKRQMQIIQLSGAINGKKSATGQQQGSKTKTSGQYKALLENVDESYDEVGDEKIKFVLTEDEDSDRSFV